MRAATFNRRNTSPAPPFSTALNTIQAINAVIEHLKHEAHQRDALRTTSE
jgi:hypothetical protein